jgi:hypothetical protein
MSLPSSNRFPKYRQSPVFLVSTDPSASHGISSLKWRMRFVVSLGPLSVNWTLSAFLGSGERVDSNMAEFLDQVEDLTFQPGPASLGPLSANKNSLKSSTYQVERQE